MPATSALLIRFCSPELKEYAPTAVYYPWRNRMTDSPATRQSLVARLKNPRDEQAWGEFVEIYTPLISSLAHTKGWQAADSADLARRSFGRWRGPSTDTTRIPHAARSEAGCSESPATS